MKKFIPKAEASFNGDFFEFLSIDRGMIGIASLTIEPQFLTLDAEDEMIGSALRWALDNSKPIPFDEFQIIWKSKSVEKKSDERRLAVMDKYGYKTKRALYRKMNCCWVTIENDLIRIQPTHHKALENYTGISNDGPEIQYLPLTISNTELGAALREGFSRCTGSA